VTISLSNRSVALLTALVAVAVSLPADLTEAAVERDGRMYAARYISPSGDNGLGDGSIGSPWRTFQYAIDLLSHDDTVFALAGTYGGYGNRNITTDGKRLLVKGVDGPLSTTINAETESYGFFHSLSGELLTIEGLRIIHAGTGIYMPMTQVAVRDCHLDACNTGIYLTRGEVRYCEIVDNNFYGVHVPSGVMDVDVVGCLIEGNGGFFGPGYGLYSELAFSDPAIVRLDSCDFVDNYSGLYGSFELHNSTVSGGYYGIEGGHGHLNDVFYCTFYGIDTGVVIAAEVTTLTNCTIRNNWGIIAYAGCDRRLYLDTCDMYNNYGSGIYGDADCSELAIVNMDYCLYHSNSMGVVFFSVPPLVGIYGFFADHCTFANNSGDALDLGSVGGSSGDNFSVTNCLIAFNSGWGISCESGNEIECNNSVGNSSGNYDPNYLGSSGNISADPLFCDTSSGSYGISNGSPCAPDNNDCGALMGRDGVDCTVAADEIQIVRPIGEEQVISGSEYPIQWVKGEAIASVNVDLTINLGGSWQRISSGNTGTDFTWTVVDSQVGSDSRVRVLNASKGIGGDTSSGSFPVEPDPTDDPEEEVKAPSDSTGIIVPGEFDDITKGGDNITDIGFAYYDGRVEIYYGLPGGGFDTIPSVALNADPGIVTWAAADMNNDGSLDIILGNEITETVDVYLADQLGGFSFAEPSEEMARGVPIDPILMGVADFNRDGHQDIWVIS